MILSPAKYALLEKIINAKLTAAEIEQVNTKISQIISNRTQKAKEKK